MTNDQRPSVLKQLARRAAERSDEECDLCGEPIPTEHRHLLDVHTRQLSCVCRACTILFDHTGAGAETRRLIPNRVRFLADFDMPDPVWESLRLPVNLVFMVRHSGAGRTLAFYPGPMGPTESQLHLETWEDLVRRNAVLDGLAPDVEALLVNRVRTAREYYLVPIDSCYELVGIIRTTWKGLSGGREVWSEIDRFFATLKMRAGHGRRPHA